MDESAKSRDFFQDNNYQKQQVLNHTQQLE